MTDPRAVQAVRQELMPSKVRKWEELVELYQKKWQRRRKQERLVRERQEQRKLNMPLRPVKSRRRDVDALVESGAPPELISRTIRARTRLSRIESEAVRQLELIFRSQGAAELRRDPDLYPRGFPPVIADVEVSADARTAIVRWSPPLVDGLAGNNAGDTLQMGPVRKAGLEAAARASDAGFASLQDVSRGLAREALSRAEQHRVDRAKEHVRKSAARRVQPDTRHTDLLTQYGIDWRRIARGASHGRGGAGGRLQPGAGEYARATLYSASGSEDLAVDPLGPGASRL